MCPTSDKNGGTVAFNYNENTLDYVAGNSNAVQTVYLSAFGITTEEQENAVEVVAEPYLVADISGNSYPTVKIGSEVWLGLTSVQQNLVMVRRYHLVL